MDRRLSTTAVATLAALAAGLMASSPALAALPEKPLTKPATEITGTTATLNGVLNPKTKATAGYYFVYGNTGICEGVKTEPGSEATGKAIKVSTPITGLIPKTKYTFCVVATNGAKEEMSGSPASFETLPVKPLVEEESVSAITETNATLSALINPELQETTCKAFQYVAEATFKVSEYAGAPEATCEPQNLGSGSSGEKGGASLTNLTANTTYHYRVLAENASGLSEGPDQTLLTLPNPPTVSTGEASSITANGATIAGGVNPGSVGPNSDTKYFFQYGLTTSYGAQIPLVAGDAGQGTNPVLETANLTGLESGTTYHYRVVATNDETNTPQTALGADRTFSTEPTPPILSGVLVSGVTQRTATITATLDPRGLPTRYELAIGSSSGLLQTVASGNTAAMLPLALNVISLSPGTIYYYKLIAINLDDIKSPVEAEGSFVTVAGSVASSPLTQPSAPSLLATPAIAFPTEPSAGAVLGTKAKGPTNAQKLAAALKACRKKPKQGRAACEKQARRRYRVAGESPKIKRQSKSETLVA